VSTTSTPAVATASVPGEITAISAPPRRVRRQQRRTTTAKHLRANLTAYLMLTPMVVLLGIFVIWPLIYAVYLSLHRISFYKPPKYVGLQFYQYVLTDPAFWASIGTGLKYSAMVVPAGMIIALLLASFIASLSRRAAGFLKTTVYVPAVVSSVIAAAIFVFIYQDQGLANWFIGLFGLGPVAWLNDPAVALPAIAVPGIWLGFGITTLIMLAGLLDIPESYYESASLDGAGFWAKTWYITIPSLKNVLLYLLVIGFILSMQEFLLPLLMTNGGPAGATTTPNVFIFNNFRDGTPYATSYSLTAALLLFVVLGTMSALMFRLINSEKAGDA
jgi:multiple sugar transport system permease protein